MMAVETRAGRPVLWVGTSRGVFRVQGPRVQRFGSEHGLRHEEIHAVLVLRGGGVLVGTGRGAAMIRGDQVSVLGVKQGLPVASVWSAVEDSDGSLWLGTSRGLYRWSPRARRYQRLSVSSGHLKEDYITALALHRGVLYAVTYNSGVTRLRRDGEGFQTTHLGGGWINFNGLRVQGSSLLACSMSGLRSLALTGRARWIHHPELAPGKDVTATATLDHRLWVASRRGLSGHRDRLRQ